MKKIFTLLLCSALFAGTCWGTIVTIGSGDATAKNLPLYPEKKYSITQFLYLASEIGSPVEDKISKISFKAAASSASYTRNLTIYIQHYSSNTLSGWNNATGTPVYTGNVTIPATASWYDITLSTPFIWNKSSNLLISIADNTNSTISDGCCYVDKTSSTDRACGTGGTGSYNPCSYSGYAGSRSGIPQIKITFSSGSTPPAAPTNIQVGVITKNSAATSWTGVDGVDSYSLQYKEKGSSTYSIIDNITNPSYTLTGLEPNTTYVFGVKSVKGSESSDFTSDTEFTTQQDEPTHKHGEITFDPWESATSLPTSGNYYLKSDVSLSGYKNWSTIGDLNLCLNGKKVDLGSYCGEINDVVVIYDEEGGGKITSSITSNGTLVIPYDGSLTLNGCTIENTGTTNFASAVKANSTAIFYMIGDVELAGSKADIYLNGAVVSFTADNKPNQPTEPYSIYRASGTLTSGWANMGDVDPADYFESANSQYSISKNSSNELELASAITISENDDDNPITYGSTANVNLERTLVANTYNTICLPFAVTEAQIAEQFGAGTEVQELTDATLSASDTELELTFTAETAMEAGKPYLIKPTAVKGSYTFNNVTLTNSVAAVTFDNLDFVGTFDKLSSLPIDDKNILLMGTENTLFWAQNDGGFKGLRAYFKITYHGASAPARMNTRMTFNNTQIVTKLDNINANVNTNRKVLCNGQLIIIRDGVQFNAQGSRL